MRWLLKVLSPLKSLKLLGTDKNVCATFRPMNITLTRKEFTRLIELAYIGDWVTASLDDGDDADTHTSAPSISEKRYGDLMRKLYRLAATEEDGCSQYVAPDEDDEGEYLPAQRLEDASPASRAIDQFTHNTCWDEFIWRMSERDIAREADRKMATPPTATPDEDYEQTDERLTQLEDRYRDEFVRNDLENVIVLFGADRLS
jgi:hypothetical protein